MRTTRRLAVGGASTAVIAAGVLAAPAPLDDSSVAEGAADPVTEDADGTVAEPVEDDCEIKDIDPDSNSGRGNTDDPIEERERDDDCEAPASGEGAPAQGPGQEADSNARTVDGPVVSNIRGEYQVRLQVRDGVVVDVEFPVAGTDASESRRINAMALPVLEERMLEAQSGDVEYVSGASYTSPAMVESARAAFADVER